MIKISCILPISKDLKYLNKSIESILNQTYQNFELVIVLNTRNLNIYEKVKKFRNKDNRIRIFKKLKGNLSELLNYGISKSRGEYIARQDSDDISHKKRFELQLEWFHKKTENNRVKILCGTNGYLINSNNKKIGKLKFLKFSHSDIKEGLFFANCFIHSSVMINYKFLKKKLRYDKYFRFSQDYDLWTKIINFGETCNLKSKLVFYRIKKKKKYDKKFYNQMLYAILVASNYYHFKVFKRFKKLSKNFDEEILKFEKIKRLENHIKILRYIYGKNLSNNNQILKKLSLFEIFKNLRNKLFLKTLVK